MPIYLYNGSLLVTAGGLAASTSCCCSAEDCDCCVDDEAEGSVPTDYPSLSLTWSRSVDASGEAELNAWLAFYGSSRKVSAPSRDCLSRARVYRFARQAQDGEASCSEIRFRIYVPNCDTNSLVDITDDYTEPTYFESQLGLQRTGFWQWFSTNIASGDCAEYGLTLPDWPDEPICRCIVPCCSNIVRWTHTFGQCANLPPLLTDSTVDATSCYAYYRFEDWACQNELVGSDCDYDEISALGFCNIVARVRVHCPDQQGECGTNCTLSVIEYYDPSTGGWQSTPTVDCDCPEAFYNLAAELCPPPCDTQGCAYVWTGTEWVPGSGPDAPLCPPPCECSIEQPTDPPVGQEEIATGECVSPELGSCCYVEPACVRTSCEDMLPQSGYWIEGSPPGAAGNPYNGDGTNRWYCEFIDDPTAFPSDGCELFYNISLPAPPGFCGARAGYATREACELQLTGDVGRCESGVSQSYCAEKNGSFFPGETCEDREVVNGQPGCGLEGPIYPLDGSEFP